MKLLNKKGFTLIELLAVIIILGIVMVLTIPSVIDSMNNAKYKQLQNAANKVADWFLEQYTLEQMDPSSVDSVYADYVKTYKWSSGTYTKVNCSGKDDCNNDFTTTGVRSVYWNVMEAAGLSSASDNFNSYSGSTQYSIAFFNGDKGRFCVKLQASSKGQFFNNTVENNNVAFSSGCPIKSPDASYAWSGYKKV